jgi:hypothetical protein
MKRVLPGGGVVIEPPYTKQEEAEFYGRQGVAKMLKATPAAPHSPAKAKKRANRRSRPIRKA